MNVLDANIIVPTNYPIALSDIETSPNPTNIDNKKTAIHIDLIKADPKKVVKLDPIIRKEIKSYLSKQPKNIYKKEASSEFKVRKRANSCIAAFKKDKTGSKENNIDKFLEKNMSVEKFNEYKKYDNYKKLFELIKWVGAIISMVGLAALVLTVASPAIAPLLITVGAVAAVIPWIMMIFADGAFASVWVNIPEKMGTAIFTTTGGQIALGVMGGVTVLGGIIACVGLYGERYFAQKMNKIINDEFSISYAQ